MSEFLPGVGPSHIHQAEVIHQPIAEAAVPAKPIPPLTPEQIQAVDQALAGDGENKDVAALVALWSGSMLLKDLAEEHFRLPVDDDEAEKKRKEKPTLPPHDGPDPE
jgi:hypothetical protein